MRSVTFDPDELRTAYAIAPGKSMAAKVRHVADHFGCANPTVMRAVRNRDSSKTGNRSIAGPAHREGRSARALPIDHAAMTEMRTLFPTMVFPVGSERLFKPAENSAKIGGKIVKGRWNGFPVYTLTLEERASCPVTCELLGSCYGNNTPFARRWKHGPDLEWRIEREVAALELGHPSGFVIRLHNLGDFYSLDYVRLWAVLLHRHTAMRIFGYTAHIDTERDPIAYEIASMVRDDQWDRFCIRFSNGEARRCTTKSIEHPLAAPHDAIICPAQTNKTESCSTCALCWATTKRIAFLKH